MSIKLAADAATYDVWAVISHIQTNSEEQPIVFASWTLTSSKRNYAQIEEEALALIYDVKQIRQYLYGRRFTLVTNHKLLMAIMGHRMGIPLQAAARLQCWAVLLSGYRYDIE